MDVSLFSQQMSAFNGDDNTSAQEEVISAVMKTTERPVEAAVSVGEVTEATSSTGLNVSTYRGVRTAYPVTGWFFVNNIVLLLNTLWSLIVGLVFTSMVWIILFLDFGLAKSWEVQYYINLRLFANFAAKFGKIWVNNFIIVFSFAPCQPEARS